MCEDVLKTENVTHLKHTLFLRMAEGGRQLGVRIRTWDLEFEGLSFNFGFLFVIWVTLDIFS